MMCNSGLVPGLICQLKKLMLDYPKGDYTSRKGWVFVNTENKNLDVGFPKGRLRQSERVGICKLKKVKNLILDSPKGT